jgi:hypothetical protein
MGTFCGACGDAGTVGGAAMGTFCGAGSWGAMGTGFLLATIVNETLVEP